MEWWKTERASTKPSSSVTVTQMSAPAFIVCRSSSSEVSFILQQGFRHKILTEQHNVQAHGMGACQQGSASTHTHTHSMQHNTV